MNKKFISAPIAAERAKVVKQTIYWWCKIRYRLGVKGLGRQVGGRWEVDPDKLDLIIQGRSRELFLQLVQENMDDLLRVNGNVTLTIREKQTTLGSVGMSETVRLPKSTYMYQEDIVRLALVQGFEPIPQPENSDRAFIKRRTGGVWKRE
jgi:hypothetical protein